MVNEKETYKKKSQFSIIWRRLKKSKTAMLGLMFILIIIMIALCADFIADYDALVIEQNFNKRLLPPNRDH